MSHTTSPTPYSIGHPQDVIDTVNKHSAVSTSVGVIFIALGGILIDAYQAAMMGFGNKYIALRFGTSSGLTATVNVSILAAALIGGLLANRMINRFGQKRAFIIGMGLCTIGAAAVAMALNTWWVLVCRVIMGFGLGIDFPLATNAVAKLHGSTSKKTGSSVNLWQMAWYVSTTVVYLVLFPLLLSGIAEEQLWCYGIFTGAIFTVIITILRYFFVGESAMWITRAGRYDKTCDILARRYGAHARAAAKPKNSDFSAEKTESKSHGGYGILFNSRYHERIILGCAVATMQAWQYSAVGVYLPLTLAGILSGGLTGALSGSVVVNALCGITGGLTGLLILQRLGTRLQSTYGFAIVTVTSLVLGALATTSPWLSLGLLGAIIFFHSAGLGGLGMTTVTLPYLPSIRPTGVGFARAIIRTGAIAGLIFWPMLWGTLETEAFYWLAIVPFLGFLTCVLAKWEPLDANVDVEDVEVPAELDK